jgi:hypothetical protein
MAQKCISKRRASQLGRAPRIISISCCRRRRRRLDSGLTMSLILTIFGLVFLAEFISWIGKSVLIEWFYALYLRFFYPTLAERQRKLKTEILSRKAELLKTSAQDQFAKWAKLRRSVDKGLADLDKLSQELFLGSEMFFRTDLGL